MKELSRMTLGTVQLGLNYGIANSEGKPDTEKAYAILDKAIDTGVNCLDTASGYGDSEKVIGSWMKNRGFNRDSVSIVTKFKLGEIDSDDVEYDLIGSVERSLVNLGTDYVDYLLMHDASEYAKYGSQIDIAIGKLMKQGCIKSAGASGYDYDGIENIINNDMYTAFQIPVNMLDQRLTEKEIENLKSKTIFARSVYLQGLVFMNTQQLYGNLKEIAPFVKKIRKIADEFNYSVAHLAMGYVNSLSYVDSLVVGADNPGHVSDNAKLLSQPKFAGDMIHKIRTELKGAPDWLFYPMLWDKKEG